MNPSGSLSFTKRTLGGWMDVWELKPEDCFDWLVCHFSSENGGSMFFRNVVVALRNYKAPIPKATPMSKNKNIHYHEV
jgi:hypothetical protein